MRASPDQSSDQVNEVLLVSPFRTEVPVVVAACNALHPELPPIAFSDAVIVATAAASRAGAALLDDEGDGNSWQSIAA
jgi:hypothetical protein